MQLKSFAPLGRLHCLFRWLLFIALFVTVNGMALAVETNIVAELERSPEMSKKLGLQKLTAEEKDEWSRLLTSAYLAGMETGRTNQARLGGLEVTTNANIQKCTSRLWLSKADLDNDDIVKLENGAIFKVSSGLVGIGLRRDVALIQEGSRWSLWVARKRVFRGELIRAPDVGKPIAFRKTTISAVTSDGSVITMLDNSIYEIDQMSRIYTALWLPFTEVLILETGKMFNESDSSAEMIDCRRLK